MEGLGLWIVDALRYAPHGSHFSFDEALDWIARVRPAEAILTNMHIDLDYDVIAATVPAGVRPAYDGMTMVRRVDDGLAGAARRPMQQDQ